MRHHTSKMSLTVFLGVLLGVSTLAVVRPEPPAQTRRMETWRVDDTQSLTFPLPQRTGQFLLWTAAERDESIPNDLTLEHRYGVTLTWRDGEGAVLREDPLWLASPIVVVQPFPVRATQASDVLVPVTAWISLPDDLAGRARTVEIRVPDALHAVRVRLYQRVIEAFDSPEARLARIDERTSALLADRVDLPWDELTREEAVELAGLRWRSLSPLVLGQPRDVAVKTQLPAQHLALSARRVLAEDVRPGQSVSWRIPGPVDALLLYDGPDDAFVATAVRENAGEAEVTLLPSQPPPWWPNAKALRLRVPGEGETSLTIHAIQAGRVDRMMLLLDPRDARGLDDRAHAVAVDDLIAGSGGDASKPGDPRLALVPPRIELRLPRATPERVVRYALPGAPGRTSLRLTLRPIARDGVAPQGTALVTYEVPPAPGRGAPPPTTVPLTWTLAPYERARPGASEADAFDGVALDVAEPIQVELEVPPGAVGLRVQYQGEGPGALVGASLLGPRRAGDPLVDEARLTRLRYPPEAPSSWVPLVHDPIVDGLEGEAAWRFLANTRRELVTEAPEEDAPRGRRATEARVARPIAEGTPTPKAAPEEPARSPRRYRTAPRPAGVSTRGWLVQPDPEAGARGTGWCRFPANAPAARSPWDARAFAELDGVLAVRVWAPGAATHDPQLGAASCCGSTASSGPTSASPLACSMSVAAARRAANSRSPARRAPKCWSAPGLTAPSTVTTPGWAARSSRCPWTARRAGPSPRRRRARGSSSAASRPQAPRSTSRSAAKPPDTRCPPPSAAPPSSTPPGRAAGCSIAWR
jgi:hypothetical protein